MPVSSQTGEVVEFTRSLSWYFQRNFDGWPGPLVYLMFTARVLGGELRGSDEGRAWIYPLEAFLAIIAPVRAGSLRANHVSLEQ